VADHTAAVAYCRQFGAHQTGASRRDREAQARANKEFDESLHPRDDHGKFTDGDGSAGSGATLAERHVSPEWVGKVQANEDRVGVIRRYAEKRNQTPEEFIAQADKVVADAVENAHVFVRVPGDILEWIAMDGYIKNQFESSTSQGLLDAGTRDRLEDRLFGIPTGESDPSKRPIYGYLGADDGSSDEGDSVQTYGAVAVRLKDDVKERTTFTVGDSLDANYEYRGSSKETYPLGGVAAMANVAPQPVLHPSSLAYDFGLKSNFENKTTVDEFERAKGIGGLAKHGIDHYVEAQIHGGVRMSDVESVYWPFAYAPEWLRAAQKEHGFALLSAEGGDYDPEPEES